MKPTVAIIARDEERHIVGCLTSADALSDDVLLLLDHRSSDATGALASAHGARVIGAAWHGFPAQRNLALQLATKPWVLFLDADERLSPALAHEIQTIPDATPQAGYWIPRYNLFFGQRLRGGGWYPDHQLRLLRRNAARYDEQRLVHEYADLDGPAGTLQGHLIHHNIERLDELWAKQSRYALAEARTLYLHGRHTRWRNFLGAPAREFLRRYVNLSGWRDGPLGLLLCATLAWHEVVKFAFLLTLRGR
ncbi:MAG: glycosyltransferase family 2 protein [Candidatus Viridilinea halotolerans]|uniref:Glycosyltransferase family 2 protein n=1 Tax=Candidatus Viridilinea halotolerans TaxID=2491704 RepID=A0A426TTZ5_9CHLR|nr:MAG: glycosyltransferase family 2 protein [Candidatus Viridilinea halotolerans]